MKRLIVFAAFLLSCTSYAGTGGGGGVFEPYSATNSDFVLFTGGNKSKVTFVVATKDELGNWTVAKNSLQRQETRQSEHLKSNIVRAIAASKLAGQWIELRK